MGKITLMEYFRVPPRWLLVKITDDAGNVGWGEASLEGHTQAVEGCLDAWFEQYTGLDAEYVRSHALLQRNIAFLTLKTVTLKRSGSSPGEQAFTVADPSL
jgi:L-alanine-DL-glutamate epimerase-like enolase superfamily enzyme